MKFRSLACVARPVLLFALIGFSISSAFALSEIRREEFPSPEMLPPSRPNAGPAVPDPSTQVPDDSDQGVDEAVEPIPEIQYDISKLPEPVMKTRQALVDAAKSGDIERLRPLLATGSNQTQLALGGINGDPIKYIKELAGDDQGQEILAIMEEILSAGYVHIEPGGSEDFYAWPYFFAVPLDKLTAPQRVELLKIVTAGDLEDMQTLGTYNFYRLGIRPDGSWGFFLAGD